MYAGPVAMLGLGLLGLGALWVLHRLTTVWAAPIESLPFQSGFLPQEHALSRFHARWYLATLVFLPFDVEMLFMYPWTLVVAQVGTTAVVEMLVFLAALFVAVFWAWRQGALRWV